MKQKEMSIAGMEIKTLEDLVKLQILLGKQNLKINKSQLARELGVDRRTIDKYLKGYQKPKKRISHNCIQLIEAILRKLLLESPNTSFSSKRELWDYLVQEHQFSSSYGNFCKYLKEYPNFQRYFEKV